MAHTFRIDLICIKAIGDIQQQQNIALPAPRARAAMRDRNTTSLLEGMIIPLAVHRLVVSLRCSRPVLGAAKTLLVGCL